jgi:colanic acid/amylovoran biosynthesis glycosyltransferase
MIHIALISPEKSPYSTTFIQAHKQLIHAKVFHLYGIFYPTHAEDSGELVKNSLLERIKRYVYKALNKKDNYHHTILYKYFKSRHIQLVLAEFGPVGAEVYKVCKMAGIPLLVHFHGFDAWAKPTLDKYGTIYRSMFSYASYILGVSKDMCQQLIDLGAPTHKVIYNCHGPNDAFFKISPLLDKNIFLAEGRFVDKKAPYLTILAFKYVLDLVPDAELHFIGDGTLLFVCKNIVHALQIGQSVHFHGSLSHDQTYTLFEKALCFVQHSIVAENGDSEGTPVAILEASASCLPVVSTRHAGIQDVVIHGETGYLVEEKDVKGMAAYMVRLAQNKQIAMQMGQQGRRFIHENYTTQKHIAILDELIQKSIPNQYEPRLA